MEPAEISQVEDVVELGWSGKKFVLCRLPEKPRNRVQLYISTNDDCDYEKGRVAEHLPVFVLYLFRCPGQLNR